MTPSRKLLFPAILIILLAAIVASTGCVDPTKYDPCNPQQPPCGVKTSTLIHNLDGGTWMVVRGESPFTGEHVVTDSDGITYWLTGNATGYESAMNAWHTDAWIQYSYTFSYILYDGRYYITHVSVSPLCCPTNTCCQPTPCAIACCNCITPQPTPIPCACKTPVGYTTYNNGTKVPVWSE